MIKKFEDIVVLCLTHWVSENQDIRMPALGGIAVCITQNNFPLPEYPDPAHPTTESGNCSVYLQAANDGPFSINVIIPGWMPLLGQGMIAEVFFDGHKTNPKLLHLPGVMTEIQGSESLWITQPFAFQTLQGVEGGHDPGHGLGTIGVMIRHIETIDDTHDKSPGDALYVVPPQVKKEELERRSISHAVVLGPPIRCDRRHPTYQVVGEKRDCYLFQFKYRSREALEALGIVRREAAGGMPAMNILA